MTYFAKNLTLALGARNFSQQDLAVELGVQRSTVNKWIKYGATPEMEVIDKITDILSVNKIELLNKIPILFGMSLNLTRNQIESLLKDENDSLYFSNYKSDIDYFTMYKLCGIYNAYMPSWSYDNLINLRVLKIYESDGVFYFSDIHSSYQEMPSSEYSGYVFKVGSLLHFVGEEVQGLTGNLEKSDEMLFASFKLPETDNTDQLKGICLGSNPIGKNRNPMVSPYLAIRNKNANLNDDLKSHLPENAYLPTDDARIIKLVEELKEQNITLFNF